MLEYLLGAPPGRRARWLNVELVVPQNVQPDWEVAIVGGFRFGSAGTMGGARPDPDTSVGSGRDSHARDRLELVSVEHAGTATKALFGDPWVLDAPVELSEQEARRVEDGVRLVRLVREPRRLEGARLTYAELFDLRLTFRHIDRPEEEPDYLPHARRVLSGLVSLAEKPELLRRGRFHRRFGMDSIESRVLAAVDAVAETASRHPPAGTAEGFVTVGFGTAAAWLIQGVAHGRPPGPAAFLRACRAVGIETPDDVAVVASLETGNRRLQAAPSHLANPAGARRYWARRIQDLKRQEKRGRVAAV